ncbi:Clavaminate synthase-like protein [Microthyrium microscopicum]|uniref:Clavaminate synthase-like protein n=1 Tax=Microthyrium microscopicum TaxID=703497 RepID=A0A6A6U7W4_9PEZI|nr:Clavaminate synthase-like protein [Microthyrium microscopicum]
MRLDFSSLSFLQKPFRFAQFHQRYTSNIPVLFPKGHFAQLPAISRWFEPATFHAEGSATHASKKFNGAYFGTHGNDIHVDIEVTSQRDGVRQFSRGSSPLSAFIAHTQNLTSVGSAQQVYIAQSPLTNLSTTLQADVPVMEMLTQSQNYQADVYGSSLWMGLPPTRTPLHRDPNPNLFVQLAGRKRWRLISPSIGEQVFAAASRGSATIRGEDMMVGKEGDYLDDVVWRGGGEGDTAQGFEADLEEGDGIFVPLGWWHSVRGEGAGINASVNWWFRFRQPKPNHQS